MVAGVTIEEFMRLIESIGQGVKAEGPLESLILLSMDKVASAYVLITRRDMRRGLIDAKGLRNDGWGLPGSIGLLKMGLEKQ